MKGKGFDRFEGYPQDWPTIERLDELIRGTLETCDPEARVEVREHAMEWGVHGVILFTNGERVSIVSGPWFYCTAQAPYEVLWDGLQDEEADRVRGYLTWLEVARIIRDAAKGPALAEGVKA